MTDTVIVETPGGEPYWDPIREEMVPGAPLVHFEGPASVRVLGNAGKAVDAAGQAILVEGYEIHLPADVTIDFPTDAWLVVTECLSLPELEGTRLTIREAPLSSRQITRRMICELAAA